MSHALVTVIIPKDTKDIEAKVTELLAPYDENISVDPYCETCWCVDYVGSKGKADPKCIECEGTGEHQTTYNPMSKWDWWVIGGRFDGKVSKSGKPRTSEDGGFNFGEEHHQVEHNSCLVKDLPRRFSTFAVVTPDGEWHEKGEMGWWGMVSHEKKLDDWGKEVAKILTKYGDYLAIGVDYHI